MLECFRTIWNKVALLFISLMFTLLTLVDFINKTAIYLISSGWNIGKPSKSCFLYIISIHWTSSSVSRFSNHTHARLHCWGQRKTTTPIYSQTVVMFNNSHAVVLIVEIFVFVNSGIDVHGVCKHGQKSFRPSWKSLHSMYVASSEYSFNMFLERELRFW